MATVSPRKRLQDEVTCSICLDYFMIPVTLACEHSFCLACISKFWRQSPTSAFCPLCKRATWTKKVKPNRQLVNLVEITKQLNDQAKRESCRKHQEPLKLFCKEDRAAICVVCDKSKEHRGHAVIPVEEAVQDCKEHLSTSLEVLKKQREEILVNKSTTQKESEDLLKQMEAERENMVASFRELQQFLKQQEDLLLAQMKEVKREIKRNRHEHMVRLSQDLSSLDALIQEMEEKRELPASQLLQDAGSVLQRGEQKETFASPAVFPPELKWKVWEFGDRNPVLERAMKKFKDSLTSCYQLQKAKVTLNPATANTQLVVSEDCRSVKLAERQQLLPASYQRFKHWKCVQGHSLCYPDRCYWEVDVKSEDEWAVGVSKWFADVGKEEHPGPAVGVWAIGIWAGHLRAVIPPHSPPLSLKGELKRIRVCVNYVSQQVVFFNADTADLLYTFSVARPMAYNMCPFFWLQGKSQLTLS